MDLDRDPQTIAYAAAEEIRALNHRTLDPKAFAYPGDVSSVVEALAQVLERLPQSLTQAEAGLKRFADDQEIRMADGSDPATEAAAVRQALLNTAALIEAARAALRGASPISNMGGHFADEDDETAS